MRLRCQHCFCSARIYPLLTISVNSRIRDPPSIPVPGNAPRKLAIKAEKAFAPSTQADCSSLLACPRLLGLCHGVKVRSGLARCGPLCCFPFVKGSTLTCRVGVLFGRWQGRLVQRIAAMPGAARSEGALPPIRRPLLASSQRSMVSLRNRQCLPTFCPGIRPACASLYRVDFATFRWQQARRS